MECSGDNVVLLLLSKLDEVYCISGNTDSELRIVLRVLLSIEKSITCEYVNVEVVAALNCITVKKTYQVFDLLFICCHSKNSFQNKGEIVLYRMSVFLYGYKKHTVGFILC